MKKCKKSNCWHRSCEVHISSRSQYFSVSRVWVSLKFLIINHNTWKFYFRTLDAMDRGLLKSCHAVLLKSNFLVREHEFFLCNIRNFIFLQMTYDLSQYTKTNSRCYLIRIEIAKIKTYNKCKFIIGQV